ncbi:MAG: dephospho-CoA kinase [Candidatus Omnitrophota bacterium]
MKGKIIGITGGVAAGKTTVADMFVKKGARLVDADSIAHMLINEDGMKKRIAEEFGDELIKDGKVDRLALRKKVFSDKKKIEILSGILHPLIIARIKNEAEREKESGTVVIDAPLLVECGLNNYVDKVIVVKAKRATRIKRALTRGLTEDEVLGIMESQLPQKEKERVADYIIDNDNDLETIRKGVEEIWQKVQEAEKN